MICPLIDVFYLVIEFSKTVCLLSTTVKEKKTTKKKKKLKKHQKTQTTPTNQPCEFFSAIASFFMTMFV